MPHSIEAIVSRQVRRWEVARKARERRAAPCVAMSRLPYSGGAELARCLAERLDYGLFDKEIIEELERERAVQHQLVASLDEHVRSVIDRYLIDVLRIKPFSESNYLEHVVRTISALAEQGMAVIVGRGAPFIVRADRALRLLVVAPDEFRSDRLASQRGLAAQDAQAALREADEARARFFRQQFGVSQSDSTRYDLVVNRATLSLEGAVTLVIDALRDRFPSAARERVAR